MCRDLGNRASPVNRAHMKRPSAWLVGPKYFCPGWKSPCNWSFTMSVRPARVWTHELPHGSSLLSANWANRSLFAIWLKNSSDLEHLPRLLRNIWIIFNILTNKFENKSIKATWIAERFNGAKFNIPIVTMQVLNVFWGYARRLFCCAGNISLG